MSWFVHLVSLLNSWTFQRSLFSALFLVAFYGLFRIGELTAKSNRFAHQCNVELQRCLAYCGLVTNRYESHTFRIGGACHAAVWGYSDEQIRALGLWKSDGGGGGAWGLMMEGIKKEGDNKNTKIKWWIIFRFATQIFNGGYKRKMNTDKRWTLHMRYVCMYVYHRVCLHFKYGPRNRGSFVRSQSIQKENKGTLRTQIKCDVENLKPGRNPVWYRKPRFWKRRVWMQVKVKNSREFRRYVSQNISNNSWNPTVNKVGVLAKFVFSQALLYLFNW